MTCGQPPATEGLNHALYSYFSGDSCAFPAIDAYSMQNSYMGEFEKIMVYFTCLRSGYVLDRDAGSLDRNYFRPSGKICYNYHGASSNYVGLYVKYYKDSQCIVPSESVTRCPFPITTTTTKTTIKTTTTRSHSPVAGSQAEEDLSKGDDAGIAIGVFVCLGICLIVCAYVFKGKSETPSYKVVG